MLEEIKGRGTLNAEVKPVADEITFTGHGKLLMVIAVFLYAQAYSMNNLVPAILATMVLAYLVFARMSFNEQLRTTTLSATRHADARAFQDRPFPSSLEIYNNSPNATWLRVEDDLPEGMEVASGDVSMRKVIEPQTSGKLSYILRPIMRGHLVLDRFRIHLMDERGLMSVSIEEGSPLEIDVEPPVEKFRGGEILFKREFTSEAGTSPSKRFGRGYEFGGLRQYVPEDSFATIEWKASSRLAKLMTRLMYEETRSSVYLFLDCSRSMRAIRRPDDISKLDQSVGMAVQLSTRLSRGGYPVGLGIFDEHRMLGFEPPGQGRKGPAQLLGTISQVPKSKIVGTARAGRTVTEGDEGGTDRFITRILPFFGRRSVSSSEKAAGIYAAVERLVLDRAKSGLVVIFSDLETNPRSVTLSTRIMLRRGHRIVIVTPFSPAFELAKEDITVEVLERLYLAYQAKKALMRRLERMGAEVIEVGKGKEAELELSRRLSKG